MIDDQLITDQFIGPTRESKRTVLACVQVGHIKRDGESARRERTLA